MAIPRLPVLVKFIDDLRAIWAEDSENKRRMGKTKPLLEQLVRRTRCLRPIRPAGRPPRAARISCFMSIRITCSSSTPWCACRGGPAGCA